MDKSLGSILKHERNRAGKTVKEVSDNLLLKGFKASTNTIYSWENNNSQPTPNALLYMCKIYGINDVLTTFGYKTESNTNSENSFAEQAHIEKYRRLNEPNRQAVDVTIDAMLMTQDARKGELPPRIMPK